jgi:predicted 3-demethylubiquinone-9 3-methyltransferase (glyoxalase superfamily)
MTLTSKITACLWFDNEAEAAARFYASLFPNSSVGKITPYPEGTPGSRPGRTMTVEFVLDGTKFVGLNGGPEFKFNEAVSFQIECEDQVEVDRYWSALLADGGEESVCGWLKDRFGLSWQVIPKALPKLLASDDREKANRVTAAMMKMRKLDVAKLEEAAAAG